VTWRILETYFFSRSLGIELVLELINDIGTLFSVSFSSALDRDFRIAANGRWRDAFSGVLGLLFVRAARTPPDARNSNWLSVVSE
jgi:hypothetical protein